MQIDVRDTHRIALGQTDDLDLADPPAEVTLARTGTTVGLQWDETTLKSATLCGCPVCGCREIFRRRDFPQRFGLGLVFIAAITSVTLFALDQVVWSIAVLVLAVVVDLLAAWFTGQCLVCYRCRSEFRSVPVTDEHEPWELAIGEKYRPVRQQETAQSTTPGDAAQ